MKIFTIAVLSALAAASVPTSAADISLYFNGTILPGSIVVPDSRTGVAGNWDNQPFAGVLTFDPATAIPAGDPPLGWLGYIARDDGSTMSMRLCLPDGVVVDSNRQMSRYVGFVYIYRNYVNPAGSNELTWVVDNEGYDHNGLQKRHFHVDWTVNDQLGTSSTLFSDPNGGLSFTQPFNLNGYSYSTDFTGPPRQAGGFNIATSSAQGPGYIYYGSFTLAAIGSSPDPQRTRCDRPAK